MRASGPSCSRRARTRLTRSRRVRRLRLDAMSLGARPRAALLNEPLLTCQEAARLLAVKPAWIYAAARSGRLTCVRVGRNVRLLRSGLERFVTEQRSTSRAERLGQERRHDPSR